MALPKVTLESHISHPQLELLPSPLPSAAGQGKEESEQKKRKAEQRKGKLSSEERRCVRQGGDTISYIWMKGETKPFHLGSYWGLAVCTDTRGIISTSPPKVGTASSSSWSRGSTVRIWWQDRGPEPVYKAPFLLRLRTCHWCSENLCSNQKTLM